MYGLQSPSHTFQYYLYSLNIYFFNFHHFAEMLDGVKRFHPELIAVSAGFDAYARDPLAQGTLEVEDFFWLGESLRGLGVPLFSLLEGGYSRDLPELIFAYMRGLAGK